MLYTDPFDSEFSFNELKDKIAEVLGLSDIINKDLEHEICSPNIYKTYRKLSTAKSLTDGYYIILINYMQSSLRNSESYLEILGSLDENDIQLLLKQYKKISPHVKFLRAFTHF